MQNLELAVLSNKIIDLNNFTVDDVNIYDIVVPLHHQTRYNGQIPINWSVLSHSVLAYKLFKKYEEFNAEDADYANDVGLFILLHDAAEAYIGDIIFPLKKNGEFNFFDELETKILDVILDACGITNFYDPWLIVKKFDKLATYVEARYFFKSIPNFDDFFHNDKVILNNDLPVLEHIYPCEYIELLKEKLDYGGFVCNEKLFECPDSIKPYINCCFLEDDDEDGLV